MNLYTSIQLRLTTLLSIKKTEQPRFIEGMIGCTRFRYLNPKYVERTQPIDDDKRLKIEMSEGYQRYMRYVRCQLERIQHKKLII